MIVTKESDFAYDDLDSPKSDDHDDFDPELPVQPSDVIDMPQDHHKFRPTSFPMRALFRKNFVLQRRQTCSNVCQILTPIIVVALLLILQSIVKQELGPDFDKVRSTQLLLTLCQKVLVSFTVPFPMNDPFALDDLISYLKFPFFPYDRFIQRYLILLGIRITTGKRYITSAGNGSYLQTRLQTYRPDIYQIQQLATILDS